MIRRAPRHSGSSAPGRAARTRGVLLAGALTLVAAACSSAPTPERHYYLLRVESADAMPVAAPENRAGVVSVAIAPYLDRAGLVLGTGDHEIREASFHLWAEPLHRGIQYYLEDRISLELGYRIGGGPHAIPTFSKRIEVEVRELHGDADGEVRLAASFTVESADGTVLASDQLTATIRQQGDGYPALVSAHAQLLDELARLIAPFLR